MNLSFEFATATRVIFGSGTSRQIPDLGRAYGRRVLVVTGSSPERSRSIIDAMREAHFEVVLYAVAGEPSLPQVIEGRCQADAAQCDWVLGIGGGSVIDGAKAIAALMTNREDPLEYLEVIGRGRALKEKPAPFVAVPTTAGTGAEVTRNAVLYSEPHQVKVSLRSAWMLPQVALVDPQLTLSLPREVSAASGLDALTQLIEAYLSARSNPLTDALCLEGLRRGARALPRAIEAPAELSWREEMSLASLFSGLALANAGLGAVHGFAAPLGGMFCAPHGAVCAILLPHVLSENIQALRSRVPDSPILARFDTLAQVLTGNPKADCYDGIRWVVELVRDLKIPGLSRHGVQESDVPLIVEKAAQSSSMKANPVALTPSEMREILLRSLAGS